MILVIEGSLLSYILGLDHFDLFLNSPLFLFSSHCLYCCHVVLWYHLHFRLFLFPRYSRLGGEVLNFVWGLLCLFSFCISAFSYFCLLVFAILFFYLDSTSCALDIFFPLFLGVYLFHSFLLFLLFSQSFDTDLVGGVSVHHGSLMLFNFTELTLSHR